MTDTTDQDYYLNLYDSHEGSPCSGNLYINNIMDVYLVRHMLEHGYEHKAMYERAMEEHKDDCMFKCYLHEFGRFLRSIEIAFTEFERKVVFEKIKCHGMDHDRSHEPDPMQEAYPRQEEDPRRGPNRVSRNLKIPNPAHEARFLQRRL